MKFAVFSLMQWPEDRSQTDVFHNEIEQAALAERQGYHAVWLADGLQISQALPGLGALWA